MSVNQEDARGMDFGSCCSMMSRFMDAGSKAEGKGGFDFKNCREMMKQFCGAEGGKFDMQACMSMMAMFSEKGKKE